MQKCLKLLIIPIVFLFLIDNSLAIQADNDTYDVRFDIGYITFNSSEERGYGSYIAGITNNKRLGILNFTPSIIEVPNDTTSPIITLISPIDEFETTNNYITFEFTTSDISNINNCSLYIIELDKIITNTTINPTSITVYELDNNPNWRYWYVNCTDSFNNVGKSNTRKYKISFIDEGRGGGAVVKDRVDEIIDKLPEEIKGVDFKPVWEKIRNLFKWILSHKTLCIFILFIIAFLIYEERKDKSVTKGKKFIKDVSDYAKDDINRKD